jgi:Peptidase S24-like
VRPLPTPRATESRAAVELALATEVLRAFGELRFIARGASMLPSIFPGDLLLVLRERAASLRPGQIVLFSRDRRFCAHRVVRAIEMGGQPFVVTCGDALTEEDSPVAEHELLGQVTAVIRRGKRIEFEEPLALGSLWLRWTRWAVRRSHAAAVWLLRWHSLRTQVARRSAAAHSNFPNRLAGCM